MRHSMRWFHRRSFVLSLGFMAALGAAWVQRSTAATLPVDSPLDVFLADASTATTSVQLLELSDPTGVLVGVLAVLHFDPATGNFYTGTTILTPNQYSLSRSQREASVAGAVSLTLDAADGSQLQVTASNLHWSAFGPPSPLVIGVHGPFGFSFNRILSREADASGVLSGDLDVDLAADLQFASLGQFKQMGR